VVRHGVDVTFLPHEHARFPPAWRASTLRSAIVGTMVAAVPVLSLRAHGRKNHDEVPRR
jgi:hypothetical protein